MCGCTLISRISIYIYIYICVRVCFDKYILYDLPFYNLGDLFAVTMETCSCRTDDHI